MESPLQKSNRIEVVDALRGFAIATILVLHNMEHFEVMNQPAFFPEWLTVIDTKMLNAMFLFFGGKSYLIFAMLFGLTFFIQDSHQLAKGKDFRGRFAWRMLLLLGFSIINTAFYRGDVLTYFAILGLILIPVCRMKDWGVIAVMLLFLIQPIELGSIIALAFNPDANVVFTNSDALLNQTSFAGPSPFKIMYQNLTIGKLGAIEWNLEFGRPTQFPGFFLVGYMLGRKKLFEDTPKAAKFWRNAMLIGLAVYFVMVLARSCGYKFFDNADMNRLFKRILGMWGNIGFTAFIVGLFYSLYHNPVWKNTLDFFTPLGKMSLTCYVFSSVFGFIVYYGCGLGLYKWTGSAICFFIGLLLVTGFHYFCKAYGKTHRYGPLEGIWHKLTWIKSK